MMRMSNLLRPLAVLLALSGLVLGCEPAEQRAADASAKVTVIHNVKGYYLDSNQWRAFEAIAFREGVVLGHATLQQMQQDYPDAAYVNGEGRVLLPGLIDAHGHVMGLGQAALQADLTGSRSRAEFLQRIGDYARRYPQRPWIVGRGWNQELWADNRAFPTARELDSVVRDRPVFLVRVDGHAAVANTAALRQAGIGAATPDPSGGRILKDARRQPTGLLVDGAMRLVGQHVPPPSAADDSLALETALAQLRAFGITQVHDAGISARTARLYKRFALGGRMAPRIYAMVGGTEADFDTLSAEGPLRDFAGGVLDIQAVKLYGDGALGSRGAALLAPYHDEPGTKGLLFQSDAVLQRRIAKAAAKGYQVCLHAIGDAANRQALNVFQQVLASMPGNDTLRHRIEHAQVLAEADIPRMAQLHLIASMQPTHATSDKNMAEARLGTARMAGAYAWRSFLTQGVPLAFGSDFPVESANPWLGIHAAVTRRDTLGQPVGGWYPQQAVTVQEALVAFTQAAAFAAHDEAHFGGLRRGQRADLVLVNQDPFRVAADSLWRTRVLETWQNGKRVYPE